MTFSWTTFLVLLLIAGATFGVTEFLAGRWTTWRRYFVLRDWGKSRQLRLVRDRRRAPSLPGRLLELTPPLRIRWHFTDGRMTLLRVQREVATYNLLAVKIRGAWPAAALRSSRCADCLIDRMELFNYPSVYGTHRFTLHGQDPAAARRLSESAVRALLPQDLTLLLEQDLMLIDFSTRPFDPIELDRMTALANQLAVALPVFSGADAGA